MKHTSAGPSSLPVMQLSVTEDQQEKLMKNSLSEKLFQNERSCPYEEELI